MKNKVCFCCKETKTTSDFFKDASRTDGLSSSCKICKTAQIKKSNLKMSEQRRKNKNLYNKKYKEINKEKVKEYHKKKQKEKRAYYTAKQKERELAKKQQIPSWVDSEELFLIHEVYDLARLRTKVTNIKWQVDHIVPLQGKLVRGLHTINNLQVIPAKINQSKGNKFYD